MNTVKDTQEFLVANGYNPGPIDGQWGPKTKKAYDTMLADTRPKQRARAAVKGYPRDSTQAMIDFVGPLDRVEGALVRVAFPWKCFYGDKLVTFTRIHDKVAAELAAIFNEIWDLSGQNQSIINEWGLSNYDGSYNNRSVKGGKRPSTHAGGLAIDFAAETNPNSSSSGDRSRATIPEKVIQIFENHGWKSGGRAWGRDYMHFQATQ